MKQEIISYLSTVKKDIYNLSNFIHDNPEESFKEYKCYNYIVSMLRKYNFEITEHFLQMPTSFLAKYGTGYPKVCYLCEYDTAPDETDIYGQNLITSISVGAAIGLSKVIPKIGGTVVIIGCPGEYLGGSKLKMVKENVFEDMDIVLMAHPDIVNADTGRSETILPLKVVFKSNKDCKYEKLACYSALDACLFTFNGLGLLVKQLCEGCSINSINVKGGAAAYTSPSFAEASFYIKTPCMCHADIIEKKIKQFISSTAELLDVECTVTLDEIPYEDLVPNKTLTRIFAHNLKEMGIININDCKELPYGLGLGSVSHIVPCIFPAIQITNNVDIHYPSQEFGKLTTSNLALENSFKALQALAITGVDFIENENLLKEAKIEVKPSSKL